MFSFEIGNSMSNGFKIHNAYIMDEKYKYIIKMHMCKNPTVSNQINVILIINFKSKFISLIHMRELCYAFLLTQLS